MHVLVDSGDDSDLSRWQHAIARQYTRNLEKFPLYALSDDPKMVSLHHLFTRIDMSDTSGAWPPTSSERVYDEYHSLFIKVVMNFLIILLSKI